MAGRSPGGREIALVLIAVAVGAGGWLRYHDLGEADFSMDELDHYYAAQSLRAGAAPRLPSGNQYTRGLGYSRVVAETLSWVEDRELAGRLPSATAGVLCIVAFAALGWAVGGPWTAVFAALLLAIYPEAIRESRRARFYMFQLLLGIGAMYTGWRTILATWSDSDEVTGKAEVGSPSVRAAWASGAATFVLFGLAFHFQITTLSVAAGWLTALAVPGALGYLDRREEGIRGNPALQILAAVTLAAAVIVAVRPSAVRKAIEMARYVPLWRGPEPGDPRFYFWRLVSDYPVLVALAPVAYVTVWTRRPPLGVHLFFWFTVPFLLHSLAFAFKGERYILLAVPGLFLAGAYAAAVGVSRFYGWLRHRLESVHGVPFSRQASFAAVTTAAITVLVTTPAATPDRIPTAKKGIDWTCTAQIIDERDPSRRYRLGSSVPLPALHYWGRLDFVVAVDYLELPDEEAPAGGWWSRVGGDDWYSGRPVLPSPAAIERHFSKADSMIVAVDEDRWEYGNINPALMARLQTEGEELTRGRCGRIDLYAWAPRAGG